MLSVAFNMNLQTKMIAVFVFLLSLPILAVSFMAYRHYAGLSEAKTVSYVSEIAHKNTGRLDDYVEDLFNMSAMPLYMSSPRLSENVMRYLATPGTNLEKVDFLNAYLQYLNKIKPDTVSVYLFDNYGNVFYNVKSYGKRIDLADVAPLWREAAAQGSGSPRLISTQKVPTELSADDSRYSYYAFTVVRELKDLHTRLPIGFIAFDTRLSAFEQWITDLDEVTKGKTMLVDAENRVVYHSDRGRISETLPASSPLVQRALEPKGSFLFDEDGVSYRVIYEQSNRTGWKMFVYVPVSEFTRQAEEVRKFSDASTLLIVAFALVISIIITYALTRPLRKMKLLMVKVQRGDLNVRFNVKYSDEIGSLGRTFNAMLDRIQALLREIQWTQDRKKEVEFESLQNQINPHFIYNTLETIRMTAEANDDEETADMIYVLGRLLRYSVDKGQPLVTVEDELVHLRNYLALQNFRFSDRFVLVEDIPEAMLRYQCLKLIFQPVVENAIYHAFKQKEGSGTIRISAERAGDGVLFHIRDDGVGMGPEELKRLTERLTDRSAEVNSNGIGLRNVHERIQLHYGTPYGLRVSSELGRGTVVTLHLPGTRGAAGAAAGAAERPEAQGAYLDAPDRKKQA